MTLVDTQMEIMLRWIPRLLSPLGGRSELICFASRVSGTSSSDATIATLRSRLKQALSKGLMASGCDVLSIGLASTPLVYWYAVREDNAGGVMVTGSHLFSQIRTVSSCALARAIFMVTRFRRCAV